MIRLLDIFFAFIGTLILLPVILVISIILLFDSSGKILFRQKRIGLNGKEFTIYKFRTMVNNCETKYQFTIASDSRITRLGYFLRKWKLDEIPQFINVIKGDMSIVGPRPELSSYVKLYSDDQKKVLKVKPGITDYASIEFANEELLLAKAGNPDKYYIEQIMPRKIELNMHYINNRSISNYFRIILLTVKTLLK